MDLVTSVQLFLIALLQIICLLLLMALVYDFYQSQALFYIQCTRLAIWCLALGDAIALLVCTAKGPKHG